jgi:ABC-type antimicrobial peptide transport system permease subunit
VIAALVTLLPHLLAGGASIPWLSLAATLAIVLCVGILAGLIAVRAALRAQLLAALRGK